MTEAEEIISLLETKYAVAMIESKRDGNPKHRKKVVSDALAALSVLVEGCLPEKATYPADPKELTESVETAIVAHNSVIDEIRNNLREKGLLL